MIVDNKLESTYLVWLLFVDDKYATSSVPVVKEDEPLLENWVNSLADILTEPVFNHHYKQPGVVETGMTY